MLNCRLGGEQIREAVFLKSVAYLHNVILFVQGELIMLLPFIFLNKIFGTSNLLVEKWKYFLPLLRLHY